jgi:hypothetical protein
MCPGSSGGILARLNYLEIKKMMDRWSAQQKKGKLSGTEIKSLVKEWWYGASQCGPLNNILNPTLGLKPHSLHLFLGTYLYIPLA